MPAHVARKRFGQHFLTDAASIDACIRAIHPNAADTMVEIGPGLGAITEPLTRVVDQLHVVEIDRDIVARLASSPLAPKLAIHEADALAFDFAGIGSRFRAVGNLPYNISTPLLFHLLKFAAQIIDMHFMLQAEVAHRIAASPGTKAYGRLSVMIQRLFDVDLLFDVPAESFTPPPKVTSAFLRLQPLSKPAEIDGKLFANVVATAFAMRRKTLRNTLKPLLSGDDWAALPIDPNDRAEDLTVAQFIDITHYLRTRHAID